MQRKEQIQSPEIGKNWGGEEDEEASGLELRHSRKEGIR